jgi:hypothetical protein
MSMSMGGQVEALKRNASRGNTAWSLVLLAALGCGVSSSPVHTEHDAEQPVDQFQNHESGFDASRDQSDAGLSDAGLSDAMMLMDGGRIVRDMFPDANGGNDASIPSAPVEVHPNQIPQGRLFECNGQPSSSPSRIRRISRREWTRNVGQSATSLASNNPLDTDPSQLYPTYSQGLTLDVPTLDQYLGINHVPGGSWVQTYGNPRLDLVRDHRRELACFQNEMAMPEPECTETFVRILLERGVYFRPPSDEEVEHLASFARESLARETPDGPTRAQTIVRIVRAAWMTTAALFRTELGGLPEADGRRRLTDAEIALALSYTLSDRAPGAPTYIYYDPQPDGFLADIRQALLDGNISDGDTIGALVRRHIGGIGGGNIGPGDDPDDTPPEIEELQASARTRALEERAGRLDLREDFDARERARRGEYYLSDKMRGFFRSWLGYANVAAVFKDRPEATSRFDTGDESGYRAVLTAWHNALSGYYGHEPILIQLLDDTIARVVVDDQDVLRNLLTTRQFYLPSSVSTPHGGASVSGFLYDIDTTSMPIDDNRGSRWTTLPAAQRAGVLTHPAWLAAHGGNFENDASAIHRGKWVREQLLCGLVPDVPITVDAQLDPEGIHLSARRRIQDKTENDPACAGCHTLMNPLGYPFEIYNHAGFMRSEDHGEAPNGSSQLVIMPEAELTVEVADATEMMALFGSSPHVKRCFIRQNFRYFMGRDETLEDACTLTQMEAAYDDNHGSMIEMIVALLTSDNFLYRRHEMEEEQ